MTVLRRVKTLENHTNNEYGEPFKIFEYADDGTLTDSKTGEVVTCDDSPPTAFSVFRDVEGNEIHITHGYAVILRAGMLP